MRCRETYSKIQTYVNTSKKKITPAFLTGTGILTDKCLRIFKFADNVISLNYSLNFEIGCELPFACLIVAVSPPNLCFDNLFALVVSDDEVHPASAGLYFNVHHTAAESNKLVEIGE